MLPLVGVWILPLIKVQAMWSSKHIVHQIGPNVGPTLQQNGSEGQILHHLKFYSVLMIQKAPTQHKP